MTPTDTPRPNASGTPRPWSDQSWSAPPEWQAPQDAPAVSWGSAPTSVAPGAPRSAPGPASASTASASTASASTASASTSNGPSAYPWAPPSSAAGVRSPAPTPTPDRWGAYSSPQSAWPAPAKPSASDNSDYYSAAPTRGIAPGNARSASGTGGAWVRVVVAFLLVLALGLGLGAGAVFALGWNGAHGLAGLTSPSSSSGSTGNGPPASGSGTTVASSSSANSLEQAVETAVQTVQPSVVEITSRSGRKEAIGSGDILNTNGYIVTNDHVVDGYRSFIVTLPDGSTQQAQLVGQDANDDLAVIKIPASSSLHPIAVADSSSVQLGQFAIAVGNPLALGESSSFGIVSALNRTASEAPDGPAGQMTGLIQTSAPLNPGNSGGALVNLQGQLIGMPTLGAIDPETNNTADAIGYAIPSNRVVSVANQLIQTGSAG